MARCSTPTWGRAARLRAPVALAMGAGRLAPAGQVGSQESPSDWLAAAVSAAVVHNGASDRSHAVAAAVRAGISVARTRRFVFGDGANRTTNDPVTSGRGPWGIGTDGGDELDADFGRVSAAPRSGTREVWTLVNDGGDWDHPIHIHFEEGQILARNGSASRVPAWEKGRKDVYRLRPDGSVTITLQFRDFGGMFMEHCHNTTHEDNAMLLRWEIDDSGAPFVRPLPTPIPKPQGVTFQAPDEILRTAF